MKNPNEWGNIAKDFLGRSAQEIKNRYYELKSLDSQDMKQMTLSSTNQKFHSTNSASLSAQSYVSLGQGSDSNHNVREENVLIRKQDTIALMEEDLDDDEEMNYLDQR